MAADCDHAVWSNLSRASGFLSVAPEQESLAIIPANRPSDGLAGSHCECRGDFSDRIMPFGPIFLELQGFYQSPLNKKAWRSFLQIARAMVWLGVIVSAGVIFQIGSCRLVQSFSSFRVSISRP